MLEDSDAWKAASGCAVEAYDVACALGVRLGFDDPVAYVRAFGEKIPDARPSMLLDLLAGRPCEVDVINGAIPPLARQVGLEAPFNEVVSALVRAKQDCSPGSRRAAVTRAPSAWTRLDSEAPSSLAQDVQIVGYEQAVALYGGGIELAGVGHDLHVEPRGREPVPEVRAVEAYSVAVTIDPLPVLRRHDGTDLRSSARAWSGT